MEPNVSVLFANPNFRCPCLEIQTDFLLNLLRGVRGRENFNADFRSSRKTYQGTHLLPTFWHHPRYVGGFYAVRGGNRAIGDRAPFRQQGLKPENYFALPVAVGRCWWWAHENMAVAVGLDPVRQTGQLGIGEHFSPALEVERGLLGGTF